MSELLARFSNEPILAIVATVVGVMLITAGTLMVWLLGRALWHQHLDRVRDVFWEAHGKQLVGVVRDRDAEAVWVQDVKGYHPDVVRHWLQAFLIRTSGGFRQSIARLYEETGLLRRDLAQLSSWSTSRRIRALRRLSGIVDERHAQRIAAMGDKSGEIRLLVAQIIGRIGTAVDVSRLLMDWKITSRLTEYPVHVMVGSMPPDELRALMKWWPEFESVHIRRIVLSAAAQRVPGACWELMPQAATDESLEIRISACHAAGHMTSDITLGLLVSLASDEAWEVRAQAVKALGVHRERASQDVLVDGLCDRNFWVRQNSANSLCQLGPAGLGRLRRVVAETEDRFARDAADQALVTHALHGGGGGGGNGDGGNGDGGGDGDGTENKKAA